MGTSALVLALTAVTLAVFERAALRRSMVEHQSSLARAIAENCAAPLAFENRSDANAVLASLRGEPHLRAAVLYNKAGESFAVLLLNPAVREHLPGKPREQGVRFSRGYLEVFQPVTQAGNRLGTLYFRSDLGAITDRMRAYGLLTLGVAVTSLLAGLALSNRLQQYISRPVLALAQTARMITEGKDYSVRAQKLTGGELGLLTDAFNNMLREIEQREATLREAQEELRQSHAELERRVEKRTAELSVANREMEAFTYSVSHDLRAPLRHVMSFAKMLEKQAGPRLDEKGRRYTRVIVEAGRRMENLIDDLLKLSRISRAPLNETQVSLRQLVEESRRELAPESRGRAIDWQIGPLPEVQGDPTLLRSVMVNLLSNAIKYTRGRQPARIEIGCEEKEREVVCFVRDNGAGFDMKFVDKLFGVFQRLHRAEEFEGTGIGLASVRRVIQRHGGRTWAEGEVDHGACFSFSLPVKKTAA